MECIKIVDGLLAKNMSIKLEEFVSSQAIPNEILFSMDHAFTEHLQNLVDHSDAQKACVNFEYCHGVLKIVIRDDGKPYNLLDHKSVDLGVPFADRPVGGLGIHMIRKLTDEVTYQSIRGWNVVALSKGCKS